MKNMPLLGEGAELSLEALKANFRANDFSTAVSRYDSDHASSQDNRFYERLQKHFSKVWNAQMMQLSIKGSLLNYSSNHPVRCLEEAEAKLVAGTVMEILDNENLCRSIIEATLTSMEDSIMEDIQCYAQECGKSMEALSEKELDAAFDRFSDRFLGKMMNLLEQVQQVPEILNMGKSMPAQEDFSEKAWKNYDEINFERKWNHSRTKTGAMLELDEEMETIFWGFYLHLSPDRRNAKCSYKKKKPSKSLRFEGFDRYPLVLGQECFELLSELVQSLCHGTVIFEPQSLRNLCLRQSVCAQAQNLPVYRILHGLDKSIQQLLTNFLFCEHRIQSIVYSSKRHLHPEILEGTLQTRNIF